MMPETNRLLGWRAGAGSRASWLLAVGLVISSLAVAAPATAQSCASVRPGVFLSVDGTIGPPAPAPTCLGAFYCKKPDLFGPTVSVEFVPDPVDPTRQGSYKIRAVFPFVAEGNNQNDGTGGTTTDFRIKFHVFGESAPPGPDCFPGINDCSPIGTCGIPGGSVPYDQGEVTVEIAASCDQIGTGPGQISGVSVSALRCATPAGTCNTRTDSAPITLPDLRALGLYCPPKPNCCEQDCEECKEEVDVGGGGGAYCPKDRSTGKARLAYAAGGPGTEAAPGGAAWRTSLGRGWSHDYAERIVESPDDTHVWLITRTGNFHEFWSPVGGVYQGRAPADEYRTLSRTGAGWELRDLGGTVQSFGGDGRWEGMVDAAGNATTPSYDGAGVLTAVSFPDGRSETFSYHPDGKLASITHVGIDGLPQRSWSYSWTGDQLLRIDRPDGTAEEYFYNDGRFPGYMTRIDEIGTDGSRRVKKGWEYDAAGNTARTWRGETVGGATGDAPGAAAVDSWSFDFDDPLRPTQTLVTDPLGGLATYTLERDPQSGKTKVRSISGDCPSCGLGPNVQFFYDDPANRMLPTRTVDGRGTTTLMSYDGNGRMTSRTEALGTPQERTTTWVYGDPAFPSLATEIERPSISAGSMRRTTMVLDGAGNATQTTIAGVEDSSAFNLTTITTYTASGQPEAIDPPGFGAADVTSFTYDPARGNQLALSRTDPIVGATTFGYDSLNRRTSTTGPNGVTTEVVYDAMDRVRRVTKKGATAAEDLVTIRDYNAQGDLERLTLPEGNVIEYEYDDVGRLVTVARGPTAGNLRERTVYTLDGIGNRTGERLERWTGAAWETTSETAFVHASRCQLEKIIRSPGTPEQATTEFDYDCSGNLVSVWDANHSPAGPPSHSYDYDALDRLVAVSQPWAGGGTAPTAYGYDLQDHLTSVTDAEGNTTTYIYSDRDLLTERASPVSGTSRFAYNEHGRLVSETDGRGVATTRTVDALDRLLFVDSPENALDTTYTYDDPAVAFSRGRLTAIDRAGSSVAYTYDRFGRTIRDGELVYAYDRNGNRTEITYPGGVTATYGYDFAERPDSLAVAEGATLTPVVGSAAYLPSGPLTAMALGNGASETRSFDGRYFPSRITVPGLLDWIYTTDDVGNVLQIADALSPADSRTFTYQDPQYFLTRGDGPWGTLSWTYDKVGNRLSETRDGAASIYSYGASAGGGNDPRLSQVTDATGGVTRYFYDAAGNRTYRSAEATKQRLSYDALGRMSQIRVDAPDSVATRSGLSYDGRSYLCEVSLAPFPGRPATVTTVPTYSTEGVLHHLQTDEILAADDPRQGISAVTDSYVFYFAGRPVATLENASLTATDGTTSSTSRFAYLATDAIGTPVLATDAAGAEVWRGGFEPFGRDYAAAREAGIFLRLPGQWQSAAWSAPRFDPDLYYNVHRWYDHGAGRYARVDPVLGILVAAGLPPLGAGRTEEFGYARQAPLTFIDPLGLATIGPGPDSSDPCSFYDRQCQATGCNYPCNEGQKYCRLGGSILNIFDSQETRDCIRTCLIDQYAFTSNGTPLPSPGCDRCEKCPDDSRCIPKKCLARQHKYCFLRCDSNSWWPGTFPQGVFFPTDGC